MKVFCSLATPARSTFPYTKDATVNMEKSSAECTVNDDNPRTFRKILLYLQTSLFLLYLMEKKQRRRALFVVKSQKVWDLLNRVTRDIR